MYTLHSQSYFGYIRFLSMEKKFTVTDRSPKEQHRNTFQLDCQSNIINYFKINFPTAILSSSSSSYLLSRHSKNRI